MTILPLVQLPRDRFFDKETSLRQPSDEVEDFGPRFQSLVDDLLETLYSHKIAIGLAAPQVGVQTRLTVIDLKQEDSQSAFPLVLVNPAILSTSGKKDRKKESCMSLPHYRGEVERRHKVAVAYQDRNGNAREQEFQGFLARVVCHEIDHLDGVLYVDRMDEGATLEEVEFFRD